MQVMLHIMTCPMFREMIEGRAENDWAMLRMLETEPSAFKGRTFSAWISYEMRLIYGMEGPGIVTHIKCRGPFASFNLGLGFHHAQQ